MKPIVLLIAVLSAGLLGAALVGAFLWFTWFTPAQLGPAPQSVLPHVAAAPTLDHGDRVESLEAHLAMVSERIAELEAEIAQLSRESARRSVVPESVASAAPGGVESAAGLGVTADDREAVMRILASLREEEQEQRDEARVLRDEERADARAAKIAKELGLSLADQDTLGEHLLSAAGKRNEMMSKVREEGFDRDNMRDDMLALRDWNEEQLELLFGQDLADQIQRYDRESRGSRGFGGGGPGGGVRTSSGARQGSGG